MTGDGHALIWGRRVKLEDLRHANWSPSSSSSLCVHHVPLATTAQMQLNTHVPVSTDTALDPSRRGGGGGGVDTGEGATAAAAAAVKLEEATRGKLPAPVSFLRSEKGGSKETELSEDIVTGDFDADADAAAPTVCAPRPALGSSPQEGVQEGQAGYETTGVRSQQANPGGPAIVSRSHEDDFLFTPHASCLQPSHPEFQE